jgi:serine/threonine protein kinase
MSAENDDLNAKRTNESDKYGAVKKNNSLEDIPPSPNKADKTTYYEFENAVLVFKQTEPTSQQDLTKDIPMVKLRINESNVSLVVDKHDADGEIDDYFNSYKRSIESDQKTTTTNGRPDRTIFDGLFGCMKPIMNLWSSTKSNLNMSAELSDDYDVPFDALTNMVWLGSGAQGCVFKGMLYGQEVAIKKVKSKEEANIRNLRKLSHPNLVKFKGASFNGDSFFCIIMEFCRYGQLYSFLNNAKEKTVLRPTRMMNWAKQIAAGMNYLHSNKIIHRDLKSPNILISENNYLKISDFGASKSVSCDRSTMMSFKGTIAWMAPEVIRNEACSEKVRILEFIIVYLIKVKLKLNSDV